MKNRQHHMQDQKKSNKTLQLASLALAVASVNWMPAVVAQDAGQGQSFGFLEEIVVTARRREESAQDIPVAVTAMSGDLLRSQNVTELNDLGAHVPSFRVSNAGSSTNTPVLSIRGQRPSDVSMTLDQAVPIYFADVVMTPAEGSNLSMYDLENVQVLKGPQGTLFGRNSTGGALLLTPKTPGTTFGGYLETKLGNFNMRSVEGAVDLPVNDMLQFRVAGHALKRDGYQENVADNALHGEDYWDEDSRGIRISMNLELSEDLSNLLVLSYDENDMMGRLPVVRAMNYSTQLGKGVNGLFNRTGAFDDAIARQQGRDVDKIESDVAGRDKVENQFVANTTQYHINDDLSIKNVFGYRKVKMSSATDIDGTALPIFGVLTEGDVTRDPNAPATVAEQFSNEIQLLGNSFDGDLEWIVGAYWYDMQGSTGGQVLNILGNYTTQISPNGDVHNEAYGAFGEGTYRFDEQWALTVGLRQSWDKRSITAKNYQSDPEVLGSPLACNMHDDNGAVLPESACARSESESYSSPTWRASLSYTPNETMYYGSVSTGYRAGGFNLRGTDNDSLAPFDEETVLTYEIGSKSDWELDNWGSVRANFAAYWQDYSDIQKTQGTVTAGGSFGTETVNAAEATIKGFEADVTWAPTANLMLTLSYSFVDASYEEWDVPFNYEDAAKNKFSTTLDGSDSYFTYVPENSATASARYILPVDSSVGEISVMASVYWQDKMKTNPISNLFPQMADLGTGWSGRDLAAAMSTENADGYALWNFRVDWSNVMGSDFALAAFINNATDEEFEVGGLNVIDSLGIYAPTYGAPRTIGASLRYDF